MHRSIATVSLSGTLRQKLAALRTPPSHTGAQGAGAEAEAQDCADGYGGALCRRARPPRRLAASPSPWTRP